MSRLSRISSQNSVAWNSPWLAPDRPVMTAVYPESPSKVMRVTLSLFKIRQPSEKKGDAEQLEK